LNTINYETGADFKKQRKTWTAALLDGDWRLIDVRWICEAAYGVAKNNWRLIEDEKGKVSTKRAMQENRGTFKTHCRFRSLQSPSNNAAVQVFLCFLKSAPVS
jgi:hypothetical protein